VSVERRVPLDDVALTVAEFEPDGPRASSPRPDGYRVEVYAF
jgi:hypothetical protein